MKALLYTAPHTFAYTDVPDPACGDDDLLIRVKACGICGSDVRGATGETGRRLPPLIMGHEAAGVVEAVGRNVAGFREGDRVCFDSTVYCNRCPACRASEFNRCRQRQVLGVSTPEFKRQGAMAEYVAVPHWIAAGIPDEMPFAQAALVETVSIGAHAVNRASPAPGQTVAVIGTGAVGLCILRAAALRDPAELVGIDIDPFRLSLAETMGATAVVDASRTDLSDTPGRRADVTFEAVGFARTFTDAIAVTNTGGRVVAVGNIASHAAFDLQELVSRELTFTGSYASAGEFRQCIDAVAGGAIDVGPLISETLPLAEGPRAFTRLLGGEEDLLKIVLEP